MSTCKSLFSPLLQNLRWLPRSHRSNSTIRNEQSPQTGDKHPKLFSPVVRASLNPGPHCTTISPWPNCFQLGHSFGKSPMVTRTYGNCLLTPCLPVLPIPTPVCLFFQQFFSRFSVCLLTFQEVEPSVHAGSGAMGCSCQLVGSRDREQRNRLLAP